MIMIKGARLYDDRPTATQEVENNVSVTECIDRFGLNAEVICPPVVGWLNSIHSL